VDLFTAPAGGCVLAVGNFDGVHLGHRKVLESAVKDSEAMNLTAALLTFSEHPLQTLRPVEAPQPLMALEDRLKIARTFGFKTAFILDFDAELASMSPALFTEEILVRAIGAVGIVAGSEWRFGRERAGNMELLKDMTRERGLTVRSVEPVIMKGQPVSSTRIRDLLAAGEVAEARDFLGRPHFVRGKVQKGRGRGKVLGFPTVNLDTVNVMVPSAGVYAGAYSVRDKSGPAAINIGPSPTFDDSIPGLEVHLVGWKGDIYGEKVTISFLQRLRPEQTFPDLDALSHQIARDVERAREIFTPGLIEGIVL
jgi:riboflavin kinase/FMN adenylyltransferase